MGLSQRQRRRFKPVSLTDSNHNLPVAPNLLAPRQPTLQPSAVWGADYASTAYRQRLAQAGVVPSMSRRGNCDDNAMMESFWSTLKRGLIHGQTFATSAGARAAIFEWIEVFYNRTRSHNALGGQAPVDFESHLN